MPDRAWEQAKQPVRTCGLGLQDNTLTAPANYAAAMGDVARMNERLIKDFTQEDHMGPVMKVSAQIRKDQELAQIVEELRERTEDATTENICPQVDQIEHFPTQKQISRVLYDIKNKQLIQQAGADFQDAQMKLRHKNWLISQSQVGAGAQFKALAGKKEHKFYIEDTTFRIMLQLFLMLKIPELPKRCACGQTLDSYGHHYLVCNKCPTGGDDAQQKSFQYQRHNNLRDAHIKFTKKYLKLTLSTKSQNAIRNQPYLKPGDSVANAEFYNTAKDMYLDYTIVNPIAPTSLAKNKSAIPLKTVTDAEEKKIEEFREVLYTNRIDYEDAPFEKKPLGFEITGAMGKGMKDHVKQMHKKYLSQFPEGKSVPTLQQQGDEEHTWTANSFTPMLHQTLALQITKDAAVAIKTRRRDAISEGVPRQPQDARVTINFRRNNDTGSLDLH